LKELGLNKRKAITMNEWVCQTQHDTTEASNKVVLLHQFYCNQITPEPQLIAEFH
jgi:hypothetical protein